jgi:autotransporter-associated beta strand protein
MTNSTWLFLHQNAPFDDYTYSYNWNTSNTPAENDTAFFGKSEVTSIIIPYPGASIGEWFFGTTASQYNFSMEGAETGLGFLGGGIVINGGSCNIDVTAFNHLSFLNASTAGSASIKIESYNGLPSLFNLPGFLDFTDLSTAGSTNIVNIGITTFRDSSTAENAVIHTMSGGQTRFEGFSTGGNAQLNTDAGGTVDFSGSLGPAGDGLLTVGSIEGAGTYNLGGDQLTVGLNGLSTEVSGPIEDGGIFGGIFASLVKVGPGTLKLSHAGNTYSFGTFLEAGKLDLAAVGAAGPDPVTFSGSATLAIENAALSGHVFENEIDTFGKNDILDLSGLKFHKRATAKYHPGTDILDVHSGSITDVFKLVVPLGTHFVAAKDGQGGTKVTLDPPHHTVASLSTHDVAEQHWATDTAGRAGHLSDFLLTA